MAIGSGSETLRPRARILRTFGDELISSGTVAVLELVKNAYDADATVVVVRFRPSLENESGGIDVLDNGMGMSSETVMTAFMQPATLHRKLATKSEVLGRRVLGEKGIGRFAVSKLADRLELITRRADTKSETVALFDWSQFDDPERFLDEVEVLWEVTAATEIDGHEMLRDVDVGPGRRDCGTLLRMDGLRLPWAVSDFSTLRTALSRLISPFAESAHDRGIGRDFSIHLLLPAEFESLSGPVEAPDALRKPHYSLEGAVDADGEYEFRRAIGPGAETETIRGVLKPYDRSVASCGAIKLELRVWDRDASSLQGLVASRGQSVTDFRRELDELSGISVYRDGFRILPYGERGDDWLRLDMRRVNQPTQRLSNNQVAGYVAIERDGNPSLIDQTNREGLMQNRAFEDLRELVTGALHLIEQPRYEHRPRSKKGGAAGGGRRDPLDAFDLSDIRDAVRSRHAEDTELLAIVEDAQGDMGEAVVEVREILGGYGRLASLGRLVDQILHDGRGPLGDMDSSAELGLDDLARFTDGSESDVLRLHRTVRSRFENIQTQASVLDALFKLILPFAGRRRGRPRRIVIESLVADTVRSLRSAIEAAGIKVSLPTTETVVTAAESDLRIILFNLIENATYWLRDVPIDNRQIAIRSERNPADGSVEILISDSGPGVPPDDRERIFLPYVSTKPEGTGIGLAQSGDMLREYYDGELRLVSGSLSGATFSALLKRRIG